MSDEINGADVLLAVSSVLSSDSTGEDYQILGSQKNVTFSKSTATIDTSNKQSGAHSTFIPGRKTEQVTLEKMFVPDEAAYAALKAAYESNELVMVMRVRKVAGVDTNEEYAEALITALSEAFPDQDAATVSITLQVSGGWIAAS